MILLLWHEKFSISFLRASKTEENGETSLSTIANANIEIAFGHASDTGMFASFVMVFIRECFVVVFYHGNFEKWMKSRVTRDCCMVKLKQRSTLAASMLCLMVFEGFHFEKSIHTKN